MSFASIRFDDVIASRLSVKYDSHFGSGTDAAYPVILLFVVVVVYIKMLCDTDNVFTFRVCK